MNKNLQFTDQQGKQLPFLTTADLLLILHRRGAINDTELAAARETLRVGGVGLMPLDHDELVRVVRESNWSIGPNAELRAIRDSIHLPLARNLIQLPQERAWFKAASLKRVGHIAQRFAYVQKPGVPSINLMRALDMLRDFQPDLGPPIASAKAFTILAYDRPSQPAAPTEDSAAEEDVQVASE